MTQTVGLVPPAILVNLLLGSLHKLEVDVLMAQGSRRERWFPPVTDSTACSIRSHKESASSLFPLGKNELFPQSQIPLSFAT